LNEEVEIKIEEFEKKDGERQGKASLRLELKMSV
jgi:hypothetical protein